MKSMNILEVQGYMDGGSCIHTLMLSQGLSEYNVNVILAGPIPQYDNIKQLVQESCVSQEIVPLKGRYDYYSIKRIMQLIDGYDIHIVHTHCQNADFLAGIAARLKKGPLLITTVHGLIPDGGHLRRLAYIQTLKKMPHHLIGISETVRERVISLGINPQKITTIYNATDKRIAKHNNFPDNIKRALNITDNSPIIVCVGILEPSKGTEVVIKAMSLVLEKHPNANLIIVGDGILRDYLEKLSKTLGINDKVQFLGYRNDVPDLLNAADIVVNPSKMEGFGRVNTEAMILKKPLVCSDTPTFREIVENGVTGFLAKTDDPVDFALAINTLLYSPTKRILMGNAGWERVNRKFNIEEFIKKTYELFDCLLTKKNSII